MATKADFMEFLLEAEEDEEIYVVDETGITHTILDMGTKDRKKVIYTGDEVEE